eukprot:TRINITY_DN4192_c1_g1_i1.p1 TRINITY_DN4192_c1_g1~~TRINITY_DN4192_c1_g1_i1.p1  ORF type:complete len:170 (-),score=15.31 TRINITY_DN4192_c1_g1_i1:454-963(-)
MTCLKKLVSLVVATCILCNCDASKDSCSKVIHTDHEASGTTSLLQHEVATKRVKDKSKDKPATINKHPAKLGAKVMMPEVSKDHTGEDPTNSYERAYKRIVDSLKKVKKKLPPPVVYYGRIIAVGLACLLALDFVLGVTKAIITSIIVLVVFRLALVGCIAYLFFARKV